MKSDLFSPCAALVLAGSRSSEVDAVARSAGVPCKALAPAGGRPMVERVLQVLLDHPRVGPVSVSISEGLSLERTAPQLANWIASDAVDRCDPGDSPLESVSAWLAKLPAGIPALVTTADHALLNTTMVDQVLAADNLNADVLVAMLPLALLAAKYPTQHRTRMRFRDGQFKACNLFLLRNRPALYRVLEYWRSIQGLRKAPVRMAWRIGPGALLRYTLRAMTLRQAFDHLSAKTGARLDYVLLDVPEAAIDVDTPADLEFVNGLLSGA
jgi:GTP:adenosylcobinamide-phosphate guanylyltransferase